MENELFKGLTDEQIKKVKSCKNEDELLSLAKEEGVELTEEQLNAVNGGCFSSDDKCPHCGDKGPHNVIEGSNYKKLFCRNCGKFIKDL